MAIEKGKPILASDVAVLVPGVDEVIVGGEDGPEAVDVSEIVAGKADADHRHDDVYLYATSRNNPTSLPLKIDPVSIDGRTQFVASIPAAGRQEIGRASCRERGERLAVAVSAPIEK